MLLFFLLVLSLIAQYIELDIAVPSFPDIASHFHVSYNVIQQTVVYNFLGLCIGELLFGALSEFYGRRKIIIIGHTLLLIGATGCVIAQSIFWLLVFRFIQGIGAGTSVVMFAIVADCYQGNKATKFIGIMNAIVTIVIALAPILGSLINEAVGWRGIYTSVAIICIISWILLLLWLPETKKDLTVFNFRKMVKDYQRLFYDIKFIALSLVPGLFSSIYISFITCAPSLYMETFALPGTVYAIHQSAIVACYALISLFSGDIARYFGYRWCIINGTIIIAVGALFLLITSIIVPDFSAFITLSIVIATIGGAICQTVIFNILINIFSETKGTASAASMFIRHLVLTTFTWLSSCIYNGHIISVSLLILLIVTLECIFTAYLLQSTQYLR
ncbi:MFS transporter [Wolbachia pipientis]|uniref:MFS transporter n=1 Tax=Wolbachia pipientis TaxID=955 RepID=A0A1E7QKZ0_WOLPI|nr:MFS transporter [Wolbachia pipientis]OEY87142.1 MFS transporter [Wolbachia pipientis]